LVEALVRAVDMKCWPAPEPEVPIRCLDDYDTALGVSTDQGGVA